MGVSARRHDARDVGLMKASGPSRHSAALVRVLSKRGICSRREAFELVRAGRIRVNGRVATNPLASVPDAARIEVDAETVSASNAVYAMLNKPRGLVTTTSDEQGRETVFSCLSDQSLPRVIAVGRLDKASEGLLLLTNDTQWAARITDPNSELDKTYHVQIAAIADEKLLQTLRDGVRDDKELLRAKAVRLIRVGSKNSWIEVVLDEGRNRHIRRMLQALGIEVFRLIRTAIGDLTLGTLPKGGWRRLSHVEAQRLAPTGGINRAR